jgi:hypothetical protein
VVASRIDGGWLSARLRIDPFVLFAPALQVIIDTLLPAETLSWVPPFDRWMRTASNNLSASLFGALALLQWVGGNPQHGAGNSPPLPQL